MARKKVEFTVTLKKHMILTGETDADILKEVEKYVDCNFYQNSDSCEAEVTKMTDIE